MCEKCRCPRSDHDVSSDDISDAYDRLGLNVSTDVNRSRQASRDLASNLGYTWLPPGLAKQKVLLFTAFLLRDALHASVL